MKKSKRVEPITVTDVLNQLNSLADPHKVVGMALFGVTGKNILGISIGSLRKIARTIGKDQSLALSLWTTGIHEAKILSSLIAIPEVMTEKQMDAWVADFDSWDVCDQVCGNLFDKTSYAYKKAKEWARDNREFVKRAGFVMMAELAVHDKNAPDESFLEFFPIIEYGASDNRNFVKKAVNWALRQIGKRNKSLLPHAIALAEDLEKRDSRASRWIAKDALRELHARQ